MAWPADWATAEVITAARLKQWTDAQKVWPGAVDADGQSLSDVGLLSFASGAGYVSGRLGVGIVPTSTLHVNGGATIVGDVVIGGGGATVYCYWSGNDFVIARAGVGTRLTIKADGKVIIPLGSVPNYANNAAAVSGGLSAGYLYRTNGDPDTLCIVH